MDTLFKGSLETILFVDFITLYLVMTVLMTTCVLGEEEEEKRRREGSRWGERGRQQQRKIKEMTQV